MKAINIKSGDLFEYNGKTQVAIESYENGLVFVTTKDIYLLNNNVEYPYYSYTNSCLMDIKPTDDVVFIENLKEVKYENY